jgi:hypothetical protein
MGERIKPSWRMAEGVAHPKPRRLPPLPLPPPHRLTAAAALRCCHYLHCSTPTAKPAAATFRSWPPGLGAQPAQSSITPPA